MKVSKTQFMGAVILAAVAASMATTPARAASTDTGWHRVSPQARAMADRMARRALTKTTTEPREFRQCIWSGYRVYQPDNFIGRECVAADGEHWYAGLIYVNGQARLVTGP